MLKMNHVKRKYAVVSPCSLVRLLCPPDADTILVHHWLKLRLFTRLSLLRFAAEEVPARQGRPWTKDDWWWWWWWFWPCVTAMSRSTTSHCAPNRLPASRDPRALDSSQLRAIEGSQKLLCKNAVTANMYLPDQRKLMKVVSNSGKCRNWSMNCATSPFPGQQPIRREHSARCIITSKTSISHTTAVDDDERSHMHSRAGQNRPQEPRNTNREEKTCQMHRSWRRTCIRCRTSVAHEECPKYDNWSIDCAHFSRTRESGTESTSGSSVYLHVGNVWNSSQNHRGLTQRRRKYGTAPEVHSREIHFLYSSGDAEIKHSLGDPKYTFTKKSGKGNCNHIFHHLRHDETRPQTQHMRLRSTDKYLHLFFGPCFSLHTWFSVFSCSWVDVCFTPACAHSTSSHCHQTNIASAQGPWPLARGFCESKYRASVTSVIKVIDTFTVAAELVVLQPCFRRSLPDGNPSHNWKELWASLIVAERRRHRSLHPV